MPLFKGVRLSLIVLMVCSISTGLGQVSPPASPTSFSEVVQGLLSSPITAEPGGGPPLPPSLNSSNPEPVAPAPAVVVAANSNFTCSDVLLSLSGQSLSANTDIFLNAHRFVLQSLVYPAGLSMDTLQANYSQVSGTGRVDTINRFWIVNQVNPALLGELLGGAGTGPASYLLGMQQKGFNLTLQIMGTNRTVQGHTSQLPPSSLQPVQPVWQAGLDRHNITMRLSGAGVVPFTAALQKELVSAVLHTAASQGAVGAAVMSYSENGGAQQNGLRLPEPINQTATQSGRRTLLQASATGNPYVDSTVELLCQGCNNSDAMVAALNSSVPSMLFSASGIAGVVRIGIPVQAAYPSFTLLPFATSFVSRVSRILRGTNASIVATSTLSAVTSTGSSSGGHSSRHKAAVAVPIVLVVAVAACLAGCLWWGKRDPKPQKKGQAVSKSASGVPFNMDLDSARGPQEPDNPKEVVVHPEPDHTIADGSRVGPHRAERSWLHRLTATPMRTTSGQNWLQVMRSQAAQPGEEAALKAPSPVPQLRVAGISGQNMEVDRVVARVRARENEQHDVLGPVQTFVNAHMQEGMSFKGKYTMQSHGWQGPAYVLCSGHRTADRRHHMSVKLFARGMDYLQEKALLETPTITLQQYLPGLNESYSATAGEFPGSACPPCLVIERPACTLDHWLSNARAEATVPAWSDKVSTLFNILHAVHSLHIHRVVHCDLHPVQFGWFNEEQQWKLLTLATWSHTGSARSANMCYTLRYAAPEVVQGDQTSKEPPFATIAADVWALGVIAYEVLCGQRLFNKDMNQAEVVSMMLGYTPLPFEANPALFQSMNAPPNAQNMLRQMLQRNPTARPALKDVLSNSLFAAVSQAQQLQTERAQSAHQIWSTDFRSQMSNALDSLDSVDINGV